jgi:hypothetical protein
MGISKEQLLWLKENLKLLIAASAWEIVLGCQWFDRLAIGVCYLLVERLALLRISRRGYDEVIEEISHDLQ